MIPREGGQGILVVLLLVCSVAGPVGAVAGSDAGVSADLRANPAQIQTSPSAPSETNNSTVQHRDPKQAGEDGDIEAVRRWLVGQMTQTLVDCTNQAATADRVVCSRLNESYPEQVSKLVDVVGDTPAQDDDSLGRTFEEAGESQTEFVRSVNEFRATLRAYRDARDAGNDSRARALARELPDDAQAVAQSSDRLRGRYDRVANETGTNLSDSSETAAEISENATETAAEVRAAEFTETTLNVTANRTTASFERPVGLTGRLATTAGEPLDNRTVTLAVGEQTRRVRTDERGRFQLAYRPTLASLSQSSLQVTYRPDPASLYGNSSATVSIRLEQTNTSVQVTATPSNASYGDTIRLSGRVRAAGVPVENVPVRVTLDGAVDRVVRSDENGRFAVETTLPASVSAGDVTVVSAVELDGKALARSTARATVTVRSTDTTLSLSAQSVNRSNATVTGHLRTASERSVGGESVRLLVNGTTVDRVQTDGNGRFEATINYDAPENGSVTVVANYDSNGGNLEPSRATLELDVPNASGTTSNGALWGQSQVLFGRSAGELAVFLVGAVVLLLCGLLLGEAAGILPTNVTGRLFARGTEPDESDETDSAAPTDPGGFAVDAPTDGESEAESTAVSVEERLSNQVTAHLERGETDAAVIAAYELLRRQAHESLDVDPALTHWELLERIRAHPSVDGGSELREFVDAYEVAAFAPESVTTVRASGVTADVESFLGGTDQF